MHEPSGLESARVSWRLEGLGGPRRYVGTVVVPQAQLHIEQEKIFTGVVDTWRVGINQQYLYSSGEYLIFARLFQRKKVTCRGILTAQDSSPGANWAREQHYSSGLEQTRVSWRLEPARAEPSPGAAGLESARVQVWTRLEPAREQH